ncbi:wax ester/triacylglycerol synthase domain-containing protein [Mycobacterium asiaticum]|uniref:diacylglycerol O-acyltransferase n=1 Tax=Mycobacterium asiaticum TaxID=1790 RepID=A0A1A3KE82_MYCAS|nr:wax ester/triacylglycerol synthase domain-containing protein [Mycobacterium asiaticum]OBI93031.1 hypothetical protein A5661_24610 [Mycobacterium asiaticum]OBJ82698.1 hypothetical protein A5640_20265 [Mycobacterium asiaticum]
MAHQTASEAGLFGGSTPDQHPNMAMAAVAIVEGGAPDSELIKDLLTERIQPGFRLNSNAGRHVHRIALPSPGDEGELFPAITHALERPLDLDGPLWECWVIEGLRDDRWAILIKVHHSLAVSPTHLLLRLCDDAANSALANYGSLKQVSQPSTDWTNALWQLPATLVKAAARAALLPITWMSPTGADTTRRHYRTVRVPRAVVEEISRKFGVQPNDVALAAVTEGFRTLLMRRGEQPRADSLRALGPALPYLPVEHEQPVQQLRAVYSMTDRPHQRPTVNSPIALCAKALQALTRPSSAGLVTLATTAAGPRRRLHLLGQRMERLLPIPPTAPNVSTGVAVFSYGDELVFGITAGYDGATEMAHLADGIELGMAQLVALSDDSVLLFDRRRKRSSRALPSGAARWRPSAPPARVRH